MMNTTKRAAMTATTIELAAKHATSGTAMRCLDDARHLFDRGAYGYAIQSALQSLGCSVGRFHDDHAEATAIMSAIVRA